jgi:glutamate 5-kinase
MRVVLKIGTSSITDSDGLIDSAAVLKAAEEIGSARAAGHEVVLVTSGAISAGLPAMGWGAKDRPKDPRTLQAVSAVGQSRLLHEWTSALGGQGLVGGQILLAPLDFMVRAQYLHARATLERLLELGVVPIVNENDAVADDEIRYGDNDRIAALVAQLLVADMLVLLTDTPGLMDADPNINADASLIEQIVEIDQELEALAGGAGTARGSGGMASKLAAAKMASWAGVGSIIASAERSGVLLDAIRGTPGTGTTIQARPKRLPARKLWIGFALPADGHIVVDDGAVDALTRRGRSLLAAGVVNAVGGFGVNSAVEITDQRGTVVAKGLTQMDAAAVVAAAGKRSVDMGAHGEVVHRDDLVVMPR